MTNLIMQVDSRMFIGFEDFMAGYGVRVDDLVAVVGMDRPDWEETASEIPVSTAGRILDEAAARAGEPCLGLMWGQAMPVGVTGVVGYMLRHAPTMRDATMVMARYLRLVGRPIGVRHDESGDRIVLSWGFPQGAAHPGPQFSLLLAALCITRLRWTAGPKWHPIEVELDHAAMPCRTALADLFGRHVSFGRDRTAIHLDKNALMNRSEVADVRLFGLLRDLADRLLLEGTQPQGIVVATRRAVLLQFEKGHVTLSRIAAEMRLSPAVLQRDLRAAGTSFSIIVDDTRRTLAERYLTQSTMPLTEVALMLGFSELSAFSRAAQRWFEMSPSEYRKLGRG